MKRSAEGAMGSIGKREREIGATKRAEGSAVLFKVAAVLLLCGLFCVLWSEAAYAATNQSATNAINNLKTQQYYRPGVACPSGKNVGWLANGSTNCNNECYALIKGATGKLYGAHTFISGVTSYGYKATSTGSYSCVGTLTDTPTAQPSLPSVKALLQKAYPGDVIQFKGGPKSYGFPQHTVMVEAVDGNGIRVYQHLNDPLHICSSYYNWNTFYNTYLQFNVNTAWTKGISLYHFSGYSSKFPSQVSHTHSYTQQTNVTYSYYNDVRHNKTYTKKCSCGATNGTVVEREDCSFAWKGLTRACTKCATEYVYHENTGEYVTQGNTEVYKGDNPSTGVLTTIPSGKVVKVSDIKNSSWGRWIGKVSYGGKTGYVHLSSFKYNGSAGIHNFIRGKCSECGMLQVVSEPAAYRTAKQITVYKGNVWGESKVLPAGSTLSITAVGRTSYNYYWGYTPDGYVLSMDNFQKIGGVRNGSVAAIPNGVYSIRSAYDTSFSMDISGASKENGAQLQLWSCHEGVAQLFKFEKQADGSYLIINIGSGKALDVNGKSMIDHGNITQFTTHREANQRWFVEACSDGTYSFRSAQSGLYMDVWGGEVKNNSKITQYHANGSYAQKFFLNSPSGQGAADLGVRSFVITGISSSDSVAAESSVRAKPTVKRLVAARASIKIPADLKATSSNFQCVKLLDVKQGRTYVVEVGALQKVAGSQKGAQVRVCKDDKEVSERATFEYSAKCQARSITAKNNGSLFFYSGMVGACSGTASEWKDVRVYEVLKEGVDYTLSYSEATKEGNAQVTIKGKGDYKGSQTVSYKTIVKNGTNSNSSSASKQGNSLVDASVVVKSKVYTGKNLRPSKIKVTIDGKVLAQGRDYKVSCKGGKKIGSYTVTVTGKGAYTGSRTATFQIVPKGAAAKKPAAAKRGLTAKWKAPSKAHQKQITGYRVEWSTDKAFKKGVKSKLVKGAKKTSLKVTKLKSKKTYYVRVCSYKKVGKAYYYSPWSKVQKVKVK